MGFLSALGSFFKTIGIALGLIQRDQERAEDFAVAKAADLTTTVKEVQSGQEIAEHVHGMSDADLDSRLRDAESGHK